MRPPDAVGPDIENEPLLVRPYVRHLEQQHAAPTADEPVGGAPPSAGRPEDDGRTEDDGRPARMPTGGPLSRAAVRAAAAAPGGRARRRFLAAGSGILMLGLGAALALNAGEPPTAPTPGAAGTAAPRSARLATAAVPSAPASNTPAATGASAVQQTPSPTGTSPSPPGAAPPAGGPTPGAQPAASAPPGGGSRTGRITGVSGLCLDAGPDGVGDRIRRWECDGTSGQTWTVADDGTVQALGRCLQASGDRLSLQTCNGGPAQRWRPGPAGSLVNQASGLCLGSSDTADGRAPQRVAACNQSDAQRWVLP
ncbi:ricin-type beta-trefoil lectin domain protein [Dactylosporangium sp. NPDC050688]|uniref:ricin-type beta-trefoil lectin domain protein n=1 Tax=Dactylosporangium sp. NPDC050688 TaxID=3157217 RepID=UPI0033CA1F13